MARTLGIQTARKRHRCDLCGRRIPKGARYFREVAEDQNTDYDRKEHTNCLDFESEPMLDACTRLEK